MYIENKTMKSNIEISKLVIDFLKTEGFFDNEWVDENKFRPRFIKATNDLEFMNEWEGVEMFMSIAEQVAKDIIRENVDTTLSDLKDKGMINEVQMDNGETGYELNQNYNGEE